jgi:hypothetical protein
MQKWTKVFNLGCGSGVQMQRRWHILFVEAQVDPYGICNGLSGTGVDLSHGYISFLLSFIFPLVLHACIIWLLW